MGHIPLIKKLSQAEMQARREKKLCYYCDENRGISFIDVWFFVDLLQCDVVRHFVATFYLCGGDLDRQNRFDQSKISNYSRQYVEELESHIF